MAAALAGPDAPHAPPPGRVAASPAGLHSRRRRGADSAGRDVPRFSRRARDRRIASSRGTSSSVAAAASSSGSASPVAMKPANFLRRERRGRLDDELWKSADPEHVRRARLDRVRPRVARARRCLLAQRRARRARRGLGRARARQFLARSALRRTARPRPSRCTRSSAASRLLRCIGRVVGRRRRRIARAARLSRARARDVGF